MSVMLQLDEDRSIPPSLNHISSANLSRGVNHFDTLNLSHLLLLQSGGFWQLENPICNRRTRLKQDVCNPDGDT